MACVDCSPLTIRVLTFVTTSRRQLILRPSSEVARTCRPNGCCRRDSYTTRPPVSVKLQPTRPSREPCHVSHGRPSITTMVAGHVVVVCYKHLKLLHLGNFYCNDLKGPNYMYHIVLNLMTGKGGLLQIFVKRTNTLE